MAPLATSSSSVSSTTVVSLHALVDFSIGAAAYLDTVPAHLRGGITVWGTTDANTWLNDIYKGVNQYNGEKIAWPLLFDANYNDKPALYGFADALQGKACN